MLIIFDYIARLSTRFSFPISRVANEAEQKEIVSRKIAAFYDVDSKTIVLHQNMRCWNDFLVVHELGHHFTHNDLNNELKSEVDANLWALNFLSYLGNDLLKEEAVMFLEDQRSSASSLYSAVAQQTLVLFLQEYEFQ